MRVPTPKSKGSLVDAVLGFALGVSGVCEWLENVEKGEEPLRAAKKAYKNVRKRSASLKRGEKKLKDGRAAEARPRESVEDAHGVVIDATPRIRREGSR